MSMVRYEKACECAGASASGPAVVISSVGVTVTALAFVVERPNLACDVCGKPWTLAPRQQHAEREKE